MRKVADTSEEALRQIQLSMQSGGADKVKKATSETGIRDSTSSDIVSCLVELGKQLRKRGTGTKLPPESEIQRKLEKELETLLDGRSRNDAINPLFGMRGMHWFNHTDY
jgi:hypothetical protein